MFTEIFLHALTSYFVVIDPIGTALIFHGLTTGCERTYAKRMALRSTLIAAAKTGRRAYLCELDPIYCDGILARWEVIAKDEAVQLVCGWPQVPAMADIRRAAE